MVDIVILVLISYMRGHSALFISSLMQASDLFHKVPYVLFFHPFQVSFPFFSFTPFKLFGRMLLTNKTSAGFYYLKA